MVAPASRPGGVQKKQAAPFQKLYSNICLLVLLICLMWCRNRFPGFEILEGSFLKIIGGVVSRGIKLYGDLSFDEGRGRGGPVR